MHFCFFLQITAYSMIHSTLYFIRSGDKSHHFVDIVIPFSSFCYHERCYFYLSHLLKKRQRDPRWRKVEWLFDLKLLIGRFSKNQTSVEAPEVCVVS